MPTLLLKTLCFLRKYTSKLIWVVMKRFFLNPPENPGIWNEARQLPLAAFSSLIDGFKYKHDPVGGIIDYTLYDLDYYFTHKLDKSISFGRDCDDTAHLWFEYLRDKNLATEIYQILCIDGWRLSAMHFFTVAKFEDGYYRLFNYRIYPRPFRSMDEACDIFRTEQLTAGGPYKNLKWAIYDKLIK